METDDFTNHLRLVINEAYETKDKFKLIRQERYFLDNFKNGLCNFEIIYIKIELKLLRCTLFTYLVLMGLE